MKSKAQLKLEAMLRRQEIARKNKQMKFTASGYVRSSFSMNVDKVYLINKGHLDYNKNVKIG